MMIAWREDNGASAPGSASVSGTTNPVQPSQQDVGTYAPGSASAREAWAAMWQNKGGVEKVKLSTAELQVLKQDEKIRGQVRLAVSILGRATEAEMRLSEWARKCKPLGEVLGPQIEAQAEERISLVGVLAVLQAMAAEIHLDIPAVETNQELGSSPGGLASA